MGCHYMIYISYFNLGIALNKMYIFLFLFFCSYWAVTNIDYIHSRTSNRVFMMIFCVWTAAVIVSLAPQFGWKDPDYLQRIEQQKCMVSQDVSYQVCTPTISTMNALIN